MRFQLGALPTDLLGSMARPKTFFKVLREPFEDEAYLPTQERRSRSKTVPRNGGNTPETFDLWETFEDEVLHFIQDHRLELQQSSVPKQFLPQMLCTEISNEAEVRAAILLDCTRVVELAMRTCLDTQYTIKAADDQIVRGNMDYAGFSLNVDSGRPKSVLLPIEIKGPWQLSVEEWETLPHLMNSSVDSSRVRNAIAQIYMYMIMNETQYGVLCSKSRYFFFRRIGNPNEKCLEVSKTICNHSSSPSVRQCWLYISHLANGSEVFPCQWVEVTPPELKWVKISPISRSGRFSAQGRGSVEQGVPQALGRRSTQYSGSSSSSSAFTNDVDWFFSLPDVSLQCLELGKIIQRTCCSTVFAHKSNAQKVIKVYEFSETFETLNQFKREIDAYIHVADLHGILVPRIFGYGASWGHFLGFITMEALGEAVTESDLDQSLCVGLLDGLELLHGRKVYHGDLNLKNILFPLAGDEESSESKNSFNFRFLDFGESISPCDEIELEAERENFQNFLSGYY